ncbi:PrsW family intramembrane metalloprotease [Actinomycetospora sp. C-140]
MIAPPVRLAPQQRRTLVWPVVGLIVLGICGLVTVGLASSEIGVVGVVIGVVLALLPVAPVVAAFLWIDRFEPEPPRLLLAAFLWGAGFSALVAVVINSSAIIAAELLLGRGQGDVVGAVISAPLVEEFVKGAFVVGLLLVRRREFDGIVDGVVYAGITAAGFAFTENIIYFGRAFTEAEGAVGPAVLATFVLRGVLSPFAHPLFTAMTGIGVGIASQTRSRVVGTAAVLGGYVLAVILHALWNSSTQLGAGFFGIYVLIMLPLFAGMIGLVVWQRRREADVLARQMPGFAAAGWIAPSEVPLLSSLAGRRRWRSAVNRRAGPVAARAVEDYQHAVTELAFLRARAERGALPPRADWHAELLDNVVRTRLAAVNAPGVQGPTGPPPPGHGAPPPSWPGGPPRPPAV